MTYDCIIIRQTDFRKPNLLTRTVSKAISCSIFMISKWILSRVSAEEPFRKGRLFCVCANQRAEALCAGCRAAAPARNARGRPLPGVQRRSALAHGTLHPRRGESVIMGSYTFAESAVPRRSRPERNSRTYQQRKEATSWQETTAWIAPPSATSLGQKATLRMQRPTTSGRKTATETRTLFLNAAT